jgi:prophage tail gpP-like protein
MSDLRLLVTGRRYGGWKSVRVTRSIQSMVGSFDLEVSDRWAGQDEAWPIGEEDACRVEIASTPTSTDGLVVLDGYIGRRSLAIDANSRTLSYGGRDRAAALVDCSAVLDRWTFRNATILEVARKVAEPFGIEVRVQDGVQLPKPQPKIVVSPGDTPFQVIARAAGSSGILAVSDGAGGVVLTRAGNARCRTPLVQGQNILAASVDYDADDRFARYVVATQVAGTDSASGGATRIRAEATDVGVRRADRVHLIRPESGITIEAARARADWEARIRAARAESVAVTVQGWHQPSGELWPLNAVVPVRARAIGVDGDLLIAEVTHTVSESGQVTHLSLVRPDAFTPEPTAVVASAAATAGGWKELAGGAR